MCWEERKSIIINKSYRVPCVYIRRIAPKIAVKELFSFKQQISHDANIRGCTFRSVLGNTARWSKVSIKTIHYPCVTFILNLLTTYTVLVEKLQAAVKKGLVTLVTHVERRRWNKALELLLTRQTFTNTEGNLQVIIGKTVVDYSPSFRLYLSSTLPLFIPGEGQCPLPFSKACTINMSVSREGICDALLADTLQLERPEFDGQMRSIDRDIGLHKQQINNAKVWCSFTILLFYLFSLIQNYICKPRIVYCLVHISVCQINIVVI